MANMSGDYYIDTTAGTGGDGSSGSPWDSFQDVIDNSPNLTGAVTLHFTGGIDTFTDGTYDLSSITGQSATNTLTFQGDDTYDETFASGYYLHATSSGGQYDLLYNPNAYTYFKNFRAKAVHTNNGGCCVLALRSTADRSDVYGERCWFQIDTASTNYPVVEGKKYGSSTGVIWDNCIFQILNAGGSCFNLDYEGLDITWRKCAFVGGNYDITTATSNGTKTVIGCVSIDHVNTDFGSSNIDSITYSACDDTAPAGTGNVQLSATRSDDFTDHSTDDFRPVSGGALHDAGTTVGEAFDILGAARSATYDIGPYEYAAGGGGLPIPAAYHHYMKNLK